MTVTINDKKYKLPEDTEILVEDIKNDKVDPETILNFFEINDVPIPENVKEILEIKVVRILRLRVKCFICF